MVSLFEIKWNGMLMMNLIHWPQCFIEWKTKRETKFKAKKSLRSHNYCLLTVNSLLVCKHYSIFMWVFFFSFALFDLFSRRWERNEMILYLVDRVGGFIVQLIISFLFFFPETFGYYVRSWMALNDLLDWKIFCWAVVILSIDAAAV